MYGTYTGILSTKTPVPSKMCHWIEAVCDYTVPMEIPIKRGFELRNLLRSDGAMPLHFNSKTLSYESRISEPSFRLLKKFFMALPVLLLVGTSTFAQSTISVSISPQRAGLTVGQSTSFTASVTNDVGSAGVSWTASSGGTLSGQSTAAASFSAATAGVYTITATSVDNPSISVTNWSKRLRAASRDRQSYSLAQ